MEPSNVFLSLFLAVPILTLCALTTLWLRAAWSARAPEQLPTDVGSAYNRETFEPAPITSRTLSTWALTLVLATLFLLTGLPKLGLDHSWLMRFDASEFPGWFQAFLGGAEFYAALMLLFPRTAFFAAGALMFITLGATYSHLVTGDIAGAMLPILAFFGLAAIAWIRRPGTFLSPLELNLAS